jgi:hypothetical protein
VTLAFACAIHMLTFAVHRKKKGKPNTYHGNETRRGQSWDRKTQETSTSIMHSPNTLRQRTRRESTVLLQLLVYHHAHVLDSNLAGNSQVLSASACSPFKLTFALQEKEEGKDKENQTRIMDRDGDRTKLGLKESAYRFIVHAFAEYLNIREAGEGPRSC